jgi:hypothetical protein
MVFNATFINISVISWRSVLLVEETGVPGENQICRKSLTNFITIMLYRVHLAWTGFKLTTLVVIGTHCIGGYKSTIIGSRPRQPLKLLVILFFVTIRPLVYTLSRATAKRVHLFFNLQSRARTTGRLK